MRSYATRPLFSRRRSSTADRADGGVYQRPPGDLRSRADLRGAADRSVDVLPGAGPGQRPDAALGARAAGCDAPRGDSARYDAGHQVYGARKVWRQLQREDIAAPRCAVDRLSCV